MTDKKAQGKKNRRSGAVFELKVRKDLESKGWIVDKWSNNVEFTDDLKECLEELPLGGEVPVGKLIPAKRKYNPFNKALSIGVGFPDFIIYKKISDTEILESKSIKLDEFNGEIIIEAKDNVFCILGVEAKSNGYLDKTEKEKCKWLMDNHIFSKVLIASKGKKRGEIIYTEYRNV